MYHLELKCEEKKFRHRSSEEPKIAVGDMVIVYADYRPCSLWSLGRIEQLLTGDEGPTRAAPVKVSKSGRVSKLDRPIQHLYLLELASVSDSAIGKEDDREKEPSCKTQLTPCTQPRRSDADQAHDRIFALSISSVDLEQ